MTFISQFLSETKLIIDQIDISSLDRLVAALVDLKERKGRLFILGVGGSAANASHAVNDFRKIVGIEAYAPTDNVSELTARTNDEGWHSVFSSWLAVSRLSANDGILVLSVGGGNAANHVSPNLIEALRYGKKQGALLMGIVGRDGGYTAEVADHCVIIPTVNAQHITPHAEGFQGLIWHLIVSSSCAQNDTNKMGISGMKRSAIFLDRDGVLNNIVRHDGKPFPPASVEDMKILPGVAQALSALAPHCLLIVVTNQPDVARGITSMRRVCDMNHYLMEHLPLDDIYVCFHDDKDNCACRKPLPGLLRQAQAHYDIDLSSSMMIGDRWKDIAAGAALGVKTVWIDQQYNEPQPTSYDYRASSLMEALPWIKSELNI